MITIALVVLDLSVLWYLKSAAVRHHARVSAWVARQGDRVQHEKAYADALRLAEVAELDLAAAQADLEVVKSERAARELLNFDLEAVSAWLGDECVAAYLTRVDEIAASQQLTARRWKS